MVKRVRDHLKRRAHVTLNQLRWNANKPHAAKLKHRLSGFVVTCLAIMHRSVDLNREARRIAVEVNNEASEWVLAAKLQAVEALRAQRLPKYGFALRALLPKFPSSVVRIPPLIRRRGRPRPIHGLFRHRSSRKTKTPVPLKGRA
jgi:hypothetical protein